MKSGLLAAVAMGALLLAGPVSAQTLSEHLPNGTPIEALRQITKWLGEIATLTAGNGSIVGTSALDVTTTGAYTLTLNLTDTGAAGGNDLQNILGGNTAGAIATNFGDITAVANAANALTSIDAALDDITGIRAVVGAGQSRLEQVAAFADLSSVNLSTARGRIMDADFAKETANLTRSQILQQAGTAMLAQANQLPNNVLSLLK